MAVFTTLNWSFWCAHFFLRWFFLCHALLAGSLSALRSILLPAAVLYSVCTVILIGGVADFAPPIRALCLVTGVVISLIHIFTVVRCCWYDTMCCWYDTMKNSIYCIGDEGQEGLGCTEARCHQFEDEQNFEACD